MINVFKIRKKKDDSVDEILVKTMWKSTIMAMFFALPALGLFLGIYYFTGNLLVGAVLGFGVHFVTLAFSGRVSKWLVRVSS